MAAQVKAIAAKVETVGSRHLAGKRSLTMGELVVFGYAAIACLKPAWIEKVPIVGKTLARKEVAMLAIFLAFVIW